MSANGNPTSCGKCTANFRPKSMRCRECEQYKAARCESAKCPLFGTGDPRCAECEGAPTLARSCTNCKWNGKAHPICWACKGPNHDYQTDGKTIITLGALEEPESFIQDERLDMESNEEKDEGDRMARMIDGEEPEEEAGVTKLPIDAEKPMLKLLNIFSSMSKGQIIVFHGLLNGMSLTRASNSAGFTKQYGSRIMQTLVYRFPQLGAFIQREIQKNSRSKS